jgi:hypothetical protein
VSECQVGAPLLAAAQPLSLCPAASSSPSSPEAHLHLCSVPSSGRKDELAPPCLMPATPAVQLVWQRVWVLGLRWPRLEALRGPFDITTGQA